MIQLGKTNTLTIIRDTPVGLFLGENEDEVVLLPKKFIEPQFEVGQEIDVFIYKDSEDRLIATRLKPFVEINHFAHLFVSEITQYGAFLDWGLEKDLFVPFKEQKQEMQEGNAYVVYVYIDELTNRIVASNKINKFISNEILTVTQGEEVDLMIYNQTPLGYNCIINSAHKGLIYENDVYRDLRVGDELKGYIKLIRDNNLIDLSLQNLGFKHVLSSTDVILEYLKEHQGIMKLTDKSSPEEIEKVFNMSKATFKKSIGVLYRQRKILIKNDGVYAVEVEKSNDKE